MGEAATLRTLEGTRMNELRPYQEVGADWLAAHPRGYLGDDPGIGKTAQACAAAARVGAKRTLVIAPASALVNWERAWQIWGPTKGKLGVMSWASSLIGNTKGEWDVVILDEAHYMKHARAQRSVRALSVAAAAEYAWPLSGTPMPNNPYELYAPIKVLWPEIPEALGIHTAREWFDYFCLYRHTRYGPSVYATKNKETLAAIIKRIMLRRKEGDVGLQLPPLDVNVHLLPSDSAVDQLHEQNLPDARLRRLLGMMKAKAISDVIAEELEFGKYEKIVVGAYHLDVLALFRERFEKYGVCYIDGAVSPRHRQAAVDTFTDNPNRRVMVAQQTAAGVALNMQVSTQVALAEPSWVPDENYQFIKRIHRFGSTRPCTARVFCTVGSRDESVMSVNATKIRMKAGVGLQ